MWYAEYNIKEPPKLRGTAFDGLSQVLKGFCPYYYSMALCGICLLHINTMDELTNRGRPLDGTTWLLHEAIWLLATPLSWSPKALYRATTLKMELCGYYSPPPPPPPPQLTTIIIQDEVPKALLCGHLVT